MGFIGGIAKKVAGGIATSVAISIGTAVIKNILTPKQNNNETEKNTLSSEVAKKIVTDILKANTGTSTVISFSEEKNKKATQQFLLKLGVHVADDQIKDKEITLSQDEIEELKKNINNIENHLQKFKIDSFQIPVILSDFTNRFQNFITKTSKQKTDSQDLKNERIANKINILLNHNDVHNNPLDPANHLESLSLNKLLEPFIKIDDNPNPKTLDNKTVLQTILNAEIFGINNNKKITYGEFKEKFSLSNNTVLSESDFDEFQKNPKNIPDKFKDFKTTVKKSDFNDGKTLQINTKVSLDYSDFFSDNNSLTEAHKNYINNNAHNIFIKISDAEQLLNVHKKLSGIENRQNINFLNKENEPFNNTPQDLIDFIKKSDVAPTDDNTKLIYEVVKKTDKDEGFKPLIDNQETFKQLNKDYPDIINHQFKNQIELYKKLGNEFITDKEKTIFFGAIQIDKFDTLNDKSEKIKNYIYTEFFKSDNYKDLTDTEKFEKLKKINENIKDNHDIKSLINQELQKLDTNNLEQNDEDVKKIIANKQLNSLFNSYTNPTGKFNIQKFILRDNPAQYGKQARYKRYEDFIEQNGLKSIRDDNSPQNLVKKILALKLKEELERLENYKPKILSPKENNLINKNINELQQKIGEDSDIKSKLAEHFPNNKEITPDTITTQQLQNLLNSI